MAVAPRRSSRVIPPPAPPPASAVSSTPNKKKRHSSSTAPDSASVSDSLGIAKRLRQGPSSSSSSSSSVGSAAMWAVLCVRELASLISSYMRLNELSEVSTVSRSIYPLLDGEEVWKPRLLSALRIQTLPDASASSLSSSRSSSSGSSKEAYIRLLGCSEHVHQQCYTLCAPCAPLLPHSPPGAPPFHPLVPLPLCHACKILIVRSLGQGQSVNSTFNRVYRLSPDTYELTFPHSSWRSTIEWWPSSQWRDFNSARKKVHRVKQLPYRHVRSEATTIYVQHAPVNLVQKFRPKNAAEKKKRPGFSGYRG